MVCPKCFYADTRIYNSRLTHRTNQTWRRRRCPHCHTTFSTREYIELDHILTVVDKDKKKAPFSRVKLLLSLATAGADQYDSDAAFYLLGTIEQKALHASQQGEISKDILRDICAETLEAFDAKAYLTYIASHVTIKDSRDLKKLLKKQR